MSVDVKCGKCGGKISTMKMLKPVKDILKHYDNKCPLCPSCGQKLLTTDFSLDAEKK
jgi:NAD-dependent SIR2 family protein deacetylase